jgi:hypothetical protein
MSKIMEKVLLSKVVIECLMEARDREEELGYEDMMAIVEGTIVPDGCPPLTEESLISHAQFVIAQVSRNGFDTLNRLFYFWNRPKSCFRKRRF